MNFARASLGACLIVATACGGSLPPPAYPLADPLQALSQHEAMHANVRTLRAEARVDQRGGGGRVRGSVLMFVARPDHVRFDVMTQFGPAAILTSDGEQFAFYDMREGRFLTGPTCAQNIARLLNVPLTAEETTQLLLGGAPQIAHERARLSWEREGFYRATLFGLDGSRQELDLALDPRDQQVSAAQQRLRLLRSEIYDVQGKTRWRVRYDDFKDLRADGGAVATPFEVRIEQPPLGRDTVIHFKQITLNVDPPEGVFTQTPGASLPVEVAACDEAN